MLTIIKTLSLSLLILIATSHENVIHRCIHDQIDFEPEFIDVPMVEDFEGRVLQEYQNIRILFDFTQLPENISQQKEDYLKKVILPPAKNFWEAALKVVRGIGNLRAQDLTHLSKCDIEFPSIYKNEGVSADLVIFVQGQTSTSQNSAIASASACGLSKQNNRPVFGRISYNLDKFQALFAPVDIENIIIVTLHEMTHIFGFSSNLYGYFINPSTNERLQNHNFTEQVNGENITILNVEPLTTFLRDYFQCSSLSGAYLENAGDAGTKNSHFKKRILQNEYMIGTTVKDGRVSKFSLALLEGSGWYQADYSLAEPMTWGKGKGCDFLNAPCVDPTTKTPAFEEYCPSLTSIGCSWTGRGPGFCGASQLKNGNISLAFDYWGNGTDLDDPLDDNCPTIINLQKDCENSNLKSNYEPKEFYGLGSKCFIATLVNAFFNAGPAEGRCFRPTCELQATGKYTLKVQVENSIVICPSKTEISVPGFSGTLSCPDPQKFCTQIDSEGFCRRGCSARGKCTEMQCQCTNGWGSHDCSQQIYTDNCDKCKGIDPFRTSCYGDLCECNPNNNTCMCKLDLKTGPECQDSTNTETPKEPEPNEENHDGEDTGHKTSPPSSEPDSEVKAMMILGIIAGVIVLLIGGCIARKYYRNGIKRIRDHRKSLPAKELESFASSPSQPDQAC